MRPAKAKALVRLRNGAEWNVSGECKVAWVAAERTEGLGRRDVGEMMNISGEVVRTELAVVVEEEMHAENRTRTMMVSQKGENRQLDASNLRQRLNLLRNVTSMSGRQ